MVRQISLDSWQARHLASLLARGSDAAAKTGRPIVLYRQTVEEEGGCYEEIVCSLTGGYVIEQTVTSGGAIPPSFGEQRVFPVAEYPRELLGKSRDRFREVVDLLEGQLG